jgi:hypothetical protein
VRVIELAGHFAVGTEDAQDLDAGYKMVRMENPNDALGKMADDPKNHGHQRTWLQKIIAAAIMVAVVVYLSLVVTGTIQRDNRLGVAEFGAIVVAAAVVGMLLRPDIVDRLQKIDIAGIKLDLGEVKERQIEVQKSQQEQRRVLEDLRFAMRILITQPERDHLQNASASHDELHVKGHFKGRAKAAASDGSDQNARW